MTAGWSMGEGLGGLRAWCLARLGCRPSSCVYSIYCSALARSQLKLIFRLMSRLVYRLWCSFLCCLLRGMLWLWLWLWLRHRLWFGLWESHILNRFTVLHCLATSFNRTLWGIFPWWPVFLERRNMTWARFGRHFPGNRSLRFCLGRLRVIAWFKAVYPLSFCSAQAFAQLRAVS